MLDDASSPEEIVRSVVHRLSRINDPAERARLAQLVLGRAWVRIVERYG